VLFNYLHEVHEVKDYIVCHGCPSACFIPGTNE